MYTPLDILEESIQFVDKHPEEIMLKKQVISRILEHTFNKDLSFQSNLVTLLANYIGGSYIIYSKKATIDYIESRKHWLEEDFSFEETLEQSLFLLQRDCTEVLLGNKKYLSLKNIVRVIKQAI